MKHQQPSNLLERISSDPQICHGKPCIKGTRIPVFVLLDALAAGMSHREIIEEYPPVTEADIQAALYYASLVTQQEEVPLPA
jgi:uncharacterized protein (DUF433 family)